MEGEKCYLIRCKQCGKIWDVSESYARQRLYEVRDRKETIEHLVQHDCAEAN